MELKEINVLEGIIQQVNNEGPFAGIAIDVGNRDHIYTNASPELSYEDTLDEINLERARYLINTDEISEEMSGQTMA